MEHSDPQIKHHLSAISTLAHHTFLILAISLLYIVRLLFSSRFQWQPPIFLYLWYWGITWVLYPWLVLGMIPVFGKFLWTYRKRSKSVLQCRSDPIFVSSMLCTPFMESWGDNKIVELFAAMNVQQFHPYVYTKKTVVQKLECMKEPWMHYDYTNAELFRTFTA